MAEDFYQKMAPLRAKFLKERRKPGGKEATADFYRWALNPPNSVIFVAVKNGELAGYVYVEVERKWDDLISIPRVNINELTICIEYRGTGTGKELRRAVEDRARSRGIYALHLEVWELNSDALSFYEKLGYKTSCASWKRH